MKKKIRDDFFKEYINVTDMKPNGAGLFSFVRYDAVMEEDKYVSDLYLFDMEKKEIKLQMKELIKLMSEGVWEKEDIFSLTLLSSIAGESIFLLGPPGTGKSMIARRLKEVFAEKKQFEYKKYK